MDCVPDEFSDELLNIYNPTKIFNRFNNTFSRGDVSPVYSFLYTSSFTVSKFGIQLDQSLQLIEFHKTLKMGDIVDVLKTESQTQRKCWSKALILGKIKRYFRLYFLGDDLNQDIE